MHSTPYQAAGDAAHAPIDRGGWDSPDWQPPLAFRAPADAPPGAAPIGALKAQLNLPEAVVAALVRRYPPGARTSVISAHTLRVQAAGANGIAHGTALARKLNGRDTAAARLRDWLAAQPAGATFTAAAIRADLKIQRDILNKELVRYTKTGALSRTWGWVGPLPKSFGYHYAVDHPGRLKLPPRGD